MRGRCSRFCSSVPYWSSVGPIMVRPKPMSGTGARSRAISWESSFACAGERPAPPYSRGQLGAVQPRPAMRSSQSFTPGSGYTAFRPPQLPSSSEVCDPTSEGGQFARSQSRAASRKVSSSDMSVSREAAKPRGSLAGCYPRGVRVLLANPRGFGAGVDRAIEIVELALRRFGPPVYVRHEIVHNRHVVEGLRAKGAVFVDDPDDARCEEH